MVYDTICQAQLFQVHGIINGFNKKSADVNWNAQNKINNNVFEIAVTLYVKVYFNHKVNFHITFTSS